MSALVGFVQSLGRGLLTPRVRRLLAHDLGVFAAAFLATGILTGGPLSRDAIVGATVAAAKVTLRALIPVPPKV